MSQTRITVFGNLIDTGDLPSVASALVAPGRLVGMSFSVGAADLLSISPGSCLLPDGILLLEDRTLSLTVNNTSLATSYTVVYQLQSTTVLGGSPATLQLLSGTLSQNALTNATILGWINYPGGSVPLDASFLIQPPRLRVEPNIAVFSNSFVCPFPEAIRPASTQESVYTVQPMPVSNLESPFSMSLNTAGISFGNITAAIVGATFTCNGKVPVSTTSYGVFTVNVGSTTLFTFDTRPSGQPSLTSGVIKGTVSTAGRLPTTGNSIGDNYVVQSNLYTWTGTAWNNIVIPAIMPTIKGTVTAVSELPLTGNTTGDYYIVQSNYFTWTGSSWAGVVIPTGSPLTYQVNSLLPSSAFIINGSQAVTVNGTWTGSAIPTAGTITLTMEIPANLRKWTESVVDINGQKFTRFYNVSSTPQTMELAIPFAVSGDGQPMKLVTYLSVDFSCTVTFMFKVSGKTVTLTPASGVVSNTGGLTTQEFNIPSSSSVTWKPGQTATLLIDITAQPGRSASIGHISLVQQPSPFLLF